jgi:hypothetical protein
MEIFIPVLFVCVSATQEQPISCNFMQAQTSFKTERECRASLEYQKQKMTKMLFDAKKEEFEILEGTCINAKIDTQA